MSFFFAGRTPQGAKSLFFLLPPPIPRIEALIAKMAGVNAVKVGRAVRRLKRKFGTLPVRQTQILHDLKVRQF